MSSYITLMGAEDVSRAASRISEAANQITRAAETFADAVRQLERVLENDRQERAEAGKGVYGSQ